MFPFDFWHHNSCYGGEPLSRKSRLERKLRFLKTIRDDLDSKLAGLNAAINKVEEQLGQEDVTRV
ncbi:hypothetical protein G7B40_017645 [Aetokthonos hydrillicola Thurmond2011]|jgi:hypothetical protein|uniref:Uncharacterized protein n=1 Tax=Aetokthonos hydrillicola Thurmond2011 TaxID=2712845 RepID=A0AAP5IAW4_9CYAN|nr:hypothetical protein [Aetokthonos hydrillicola]MBO3458187.1 hypothetical protein [Aetokthonos hydrillicola CCALA 1050]MBW4584407.1 hypothetical protein [Aetokthonos hydrillicola CCALA 1050]MDR9896368.1 hypothetical protein [Aetokthonos hydrillicola Thurmond2011]